MIQRMKQQAGIHSQVVSRVVDALGEAIQPDEEDTPIYTSGATNILNIRNWRIPPEPAS